MIKILIEQAEGATLPQNATPLDSGYDLVTLSEPEIVGVEENPGSGLWRRIDYIQYRTGIKIEPMTSLEHTGTHWKEAYYYTLLFPRSSVSKYNLLLCNSVGVVDNQYRGELLLRFKYIFQPEDMHLESTALGGLLLWGTVNKDRIYKKGDKVAQLVAAKLNQIQFIEAKLSETSRGEGAFGSTGK